MTRKATTQGGIFSTKTHHIITDAQRCHITRRKQSLAEREESHAAPTQPNTFVDGEKEIPSTNPRRESAILLVGLLLVDLGLLLDLVDVDLANGSILAIDELGQLLESGALGLDVHEVDEGELEEDPALGGAELANAVFFSKRVAVILTV